MDLSAVCSLGGEMICSVVYFPMASNIFAHFILLYLHALRYLSSPHTYQYVLVCNNHQTGCIIMSNKLSLGLVFPQSTIKCYLFFASYFLFL